MYRKYRIVESITSSVSQYESYHDQVYRYTPTEYSVNWCQRDVIVHNLLRYVLTPENILYMYSFLSIHIGYVHPVDLAFCANTWHSSH